MKIFRNNKRVAELWLGDYKKYFYERHSERYEKLDIGDISKQVELKKKLICRPFDYFFDVIAKDMLEYYPLEEPVHFASGTVCSNSFDFSLQFIHPPYFRFETWELINALK